MGYKIYHGDEWRHEAKPLKTCRARTRPEQQAHIDGEYAGGRMALGDWRMLTDHLSEPMNDLTRPRTATP